MAILLRRRWTQSWPPQHVAVVAAVLCSCTLLVLQFSAFSRPRNDDADKTPHEDMAVVVLRRGSLDASERYWVHRFVARAAEEEETPCLALHASLGQTHHVVQQASLWNASLSVAVFVAPEDRAGVRVAITHLRRCFPLVRRRVTFHVVYPAVFSPLSDGHYDHDEALLPVPPCAASSSPESTLRALETRPTGQGLPYPQNLMRNTARSCCRCSHALVADVDMLPPGDGLLASRLRTFLATPPALDCRKCAFTLPVFEVDASVARVPRDKEELRALADLNKTRPFHWELFKQNQLALQPYRWIAMADNADSATYGLAFDVAFEFRLEPVFVAARGAPAYDEAFVGFGFTRNTQAYEMILAGWRFVVLDDAFLVHRGFQWLKRRPRWRTKEVDRHYKDFKRWVRKTVAWYDRDPLHVLDEVDLKDLSIAVVDQGRRDVAGLVEVFVAAKKPT